MDTPIDAMDKIPRTRLFSSGWRPRDGGHGDEEESKSNAPRPWKTATLCFSYLLQEEPVHAMRILDSFTSKPVEECSAFHKLPRTLETNNPLWWGRAFRPWWWRILDACFLNLFSDYSVWNPKLTQFALCPPDFCWEFDNLGKRQRWWHYIFPTDVSLTDSGAKKE